MKPRFRLLAAAAMVATLGVVAPSLPASADSEDVCVGQGVMNMAAGLGYPILTPKVTTTFGFDFLLGACAEKVGLRMGGYFNGWCGLATGEGSTHNGHQFVFQIQGREMVFSGELTGTVEIEADWFHSGSCTNSTATRFLVSGALLKHECAGDSENDPGTRRTDKALNTSTMLCV